MRFLEFLKLQLQMQLSPAAVSLRKIMLTGTALQQYSPKQQHSQPDTLSNSAHSQTLQQQHSEPDTLINSTQSQTLSATALTARHSQQKHSQPGTLSNSTHSQALSATALTATAPKTTAFEILMHKRDISQQTEGSYKYQLLHVCTLYSFLARTSTPYM